MLKRFLIVGIVFLALIMVALSENKKFDKPQQHAINEDYDIHNSAVVLELFTSQGCSSCPAADELLNEVKELHPDNVFTLSYHVDYWNYIGWKDPFSKVSFSKKQSKYNKKLKYRGNYTPEIVVNGKAHFTGSDRTKMKRAIATYGQQKSSNKIYITGHMHKGGVLTLNYESQGEIVGKTLRTVLVLDERTTEVKRGENRNRTIKNSNIVIAEEELVLKAPKGNLKILVPELVRKKEKLSVIMLLSNSELDISAATSLDLVY